jgi:hypothetical protein
MTDVTQKVILANDVKQGGAIVSINKLGTIQALDAEINKVPDLSTVSDKYTYAYGDSRTFGDITLTGDGSNPTELLSAITDRKIRVKNYTALLNAEGSFQFYSGSGAITGKMGIVSSGGIAINSDDALFETSIGEALGVLITPSGNALNGHLAYEIV